MERYTKLAAALEARLPGEFVWAVEINNHGTRRYMTAPMASLVDEFLREDDKMRDEVYFANAPCRLFYDMDAPGIAESHMQAMVQELSAHTRDALREQFQIDAVDVIVLDSSTPEKQSRHVFFDAVFATLPMMRAFVEVVLERCTLRAGKLICAVDMGKYAASSGNLRLPYARKYKSQARLMPTDPAAFVFEKAMVNVVGTPTLLRMPLPERGEAGVDAEIDEAAVQNLMTYYQAYQPDRAVCKGRFYSVMLHDHHCVAMGRPHKSNTVRLDVYFGAYQVTGTMVCMDPECKRISTWHVTDNLTCICRPEQEARKLHEVENEETLI